MPFGHCNCIQLHCTVWCLERSSESVEWARHFLTTKRKSLEKSMLECNSNSWRVRLHYEVPNYLCRLDHRGRSSCKCARVRTCTSTIEMMIKFVISFTLPIKSQLAVPAWSDLAWIEDCIENQVLINQLNMHSAWFSLISTAFYCCATIASFSSRENTRCFNYQRIAHRYLKHRNPQLFEQCDKFKAWYNGYLRKFIRSSINTIKVCVTCTVQIHWRSLYPLS